MNLHTRHLHVDFCSFYVVVSLAVNRARSSTSSVGSGEAAAAAVDAAGGRQQLDDDGDDLVASAGRRSRSLSRSSRHSSDDADGGRLSGDNRSRASYNVRFAEVSSSADNNNYNDYNNRTVWPQRSSHV